MIDLSRWSKALVVFFIVILLVAFLFFSGSWKWFAKLLYPLPYKEHVFRYSRQFDLDPYFVMAVMRVESRFYANAHSKRGARGLMQLMPDTARWIAEQMQVDYRGEMLTDPRYNIMLGCWYLANLRAEFQNNLAATLAAYNGGRGRVRRWLDENIWDGKLETIERIPFPETRRFVERVSRDYRIYKMLYQ